MPVVDLGLTFDGKCCVCRDWINPGDPYGSQTADEDAAEGVNHRYAHARCTEAGRAFMALFNDPARNPTDSKEIPE